MKCTIQPVAAVVAGEHPSCPIASMRRRRQADQEQPRIRIAKTRDRLSPVVLVGISPHFFARNLLLPAYQPRALVTRDDPELELYEQSTRK
jgi:hypothetical protein